MKECIAMLLAGGQGSRLYALTQKIAKPAVPFGGKYRIIDFPLSNCINSGIDTVGVLTQYQPLELNEYIGDGRPWDLDRMNGGVHVLPPYQRADGSDWYLGTANAIFQNINFIDRYSPEYVLVLSGDHIYKMDYSDMLAHHKAMNADCTISVLQVPMDEASRFGIMNTRDDGTIYEFEEKPANPKSDLASMGIYIFTWEKMRRYLIEDAADEKSSHDFGKDVLPAMLNSGCRMAAYRFEGYWKDVGTIGSLWDANMDLIDPNRPFDLWDTSWKIYSRNSAAPPHIVGPDAEVTDSVVSEGCTIDGNIDFSVIYHDVTVEEGAEVNYSVVMPGSVIKSGAKVQYSIVAENVTVESGAAVGEAPEDIESERPWDVAVVGNGLTIHSGAQVKAGSIVYEDVKEGETVC